MKQIFNDGVMEVTEYNEGWLYLRWVDNDHGCLRKKLVKDFIYIESYILKNHLKGWFTASERAHGDFQMLLHRIGAKFYLKDPEYIYFQKWISKPEDLYHVQKRSIGSRITTIP